MGHVINIKNKLTHVHNAINNIQQATGAISDMNINVKRIVTNSTNRMQKLLDKSKQDLINYINDFE